MRKQHETKKNNKDFSRRPEGNQRLNRDAIAVETEKGKGRSTGSGAEKSAKRTVDDAPAE